MTLTLHESHDILSSKKRSLGLNYLYINAEIFRNSFDLYYSEIQVSVLVFVLILISIVVIAVFIFVTYHGLPSHFTVERYKISTFPLIKPRHRCSRHFGAANRLPYPPW
jgi:hypothetical protein